MAEFDFAVHFVKIMGCSASTEESFDMADATGLEQHYNMTINVRSPHIRLDCMKQIKTIDMIDEECTYKLRYAYVSQRGYYPHGMFRHFYFLFL